MSLTLLTKSQPDGRLQVTFQQRDKQFQVMLDPAEVRQIARTIWKACEHATREAASRGRDWSTLVEVTFVEPEAVTAPVSFWAGRDVWQVIAGMLHARAEPTVAGHA